jgi:hypothetical protein
VTTAAGLERVCMLLADLSGYTAYMANSEPDHPPALAGDLVETVVRQVRPTFQLAKLEGDAALLVAPLERLDGPMLLDAIDAAYDAFRRRVQSVTAATTCDCASCSRVPDLDLKFAPPAQGGFAGRGGAHPLRPAHRFDRAGPGARSRRPRHASRH